MKKRRLLNDISAESLEKMIPCFKPLIRHYARGEEIMAYADKEPERIAVLLKGRARLEILSLEGDVFRLEDYEQGDVFGELFTLPLRESSYIVTAEEPSQVVYLDYIHVISPCEKICAHHTQLISNLFIMTAQKTQELSLHLSVLGQHTTREKLLTYLRYAREQSGAAGMEAFQIPLTLSKLADYLCVDRSAMTREIKALREEGLVEAERRTFRLIG